MPRKPLKRPKEIYKLLKQNGLTPNTDGEATFLPSSKSLILACHNEENRALVIKILLAEDPSWRRRFFNEIQFYKIFKKETLPFIPKVVGTSLEDPLPFILLEKIEGTPLSPTRIPHRAKPEWVSKVADLLEKIQNLPLEDSNLPHNNGDFLIQKVLKYEENPPIPRPIFKEVISRLEEARSELNNACRVLVHGDFMLQNIIESDAGLIVVDWEFAGVGNRAYDAATLWLTTFKLRRWRKAFLEKLLKQVEKPEVFKSLFVLNLLRLYLREIGMWRKLWQHKEAAVVEETCEKELRLALKGFDSLFEDG